MDSDDTADAGLDQPAAARLLEKRVGGRPARIGEQGLRRETWQ
jgi:hypothetical protein